MEPHDVIRAFSEPKLLRLRDMKLPYWEARQRDFASLLAHDAAGLKALTSWEHDETSGIALLLVHAVRWHVNRTQAHREKALELAEEAMKRMLARRLFKRPLGSPNTELLVIAVAYFKTPLRRRIGSLPADNLPGDHEPSPPEPPRALGPLTIPDSYRVQLFHLRNAIEPARNPSLRLSQVLEAERALGRSIPNRLLALWSVVGVSWEDMVGRTQDLERDARKESSFHSPGICTGQETLDLNGYHMPICAKPRQDADWVFAWDWKSYAELPYRVGMDSFERGSTFADFLTWRWGQYQKLPRGQKPFDLDTPNIDLDAPVTAHQLASFMPSLVVDPPRAVRLARHAKFGEGEVLAEADGKMTVAFPSGTRTLIASVLTLVDD